MRIGNTDRPCREYIDKLVSGTLFFYEGRLYIKTDMMYVNYTSVPEVNIPVFATRLNDGVLVCFESDRNMEGSKYPVELFDGIVVSREKLVEHLSFPDAYEKVTGEEVPW